MKDMAPPAISCVEWVNGQDSVVQPVVQSVVQHQDLALSTCQRLSAPSSHPQPLHTQRHPVRHSSLSPSPLSPSLPTKQCKHSLSSNLTKSFFSSPSGLIIHQQDTVLRKSNLHAAGLSFESFHITTVTPSNLAPQLPQRIPQSHPPLPDHTVAGSQLPRPKIHSRRAGRNGTRSRQVPAPFNKLLLDPTDRTFLPSITVNKTRPPVSPHSSHSSRIIPADLKRHVDGDNTAHSIHPPSNYQPPTPLHVVDSVILSQPSTTIINSDLSPVCTSTADPKDPKDSKQPRVRSLIMPMSAMPAMTTLASHRRESPGRDSPGSPPELTDSKSSKSSSFQSSSLADAVSCDLSNFEDISLDDMAADLHQSHNPASSHFYRFSHHSRSFRDLTNSSTRSASNVPNASSGPKSAGLPSQPSKYQLPVPGPRARGNRRQLPQLVSNLGPPVVTRSRSPSPTSATRNISPSTRSLPAGSSSSSFTNFSASSFQAKRRQTVTSARKTVKELEDEYDDLDEELPDDAVMYNVPFSPRPPHEREQGPLTRSDSDPTPLSATFPLSSGVDSGTPSRDRSLERVSTNLSTMSAPSGLNVQGIQSPTDLPLSPNLSDASSDFRPIGAVKTRQAALSDLSKEARELTEALEMHADETEKKHEAAVQAGETKPVNPESACAPAKIALPPIRKNDPLIDPLPISKEKERFLTRTRPSWLPPKSQKEEKKHLKEYQKMMAQAAEAEKKRARKEQKLQSERDAAALERTKAWDVHVLPNWNSAVHEPKTRHLWWKGVPPMRRGDVWSKAVGNELGLSHQSFEAAVTRAKEIYGRLDGLSDADKDKDEFGAVVASIKHNCALVFPDLHIFQPGGPLHDELLELCMAYAVYRMCPDWDSGIQSLAALLLLNLPIPSAFVTLANILHRPLPAALLSHDPHTLNSSYQLILATLAYHRPQLHAHLITIRNIAPLATYAEESEFSEPPTPITPAGSCARSRSPTPTPGPLLSPSLYLYPIIHALTTAGPHVSVETAARLWDVVVFEGDTALVRAAVAVLTRLEGKLYGSGEEIMGELEEAGLWEIGSTEDFMECVREIGRVDGDR